MQAKMSQELILALRKMKYVLNHLWKFETPFLAWFSGFLQTSMIAFIVILNYFAIMLEEAPIDIVMNFLALVVITELDNYFFTA